MMGIAPTFYAASFTRHLGLLGGINDLNFERPNGCLNAYLISALSQPEAKSVSREQPRASALHER
jgi:hypothetical protein